MKMCSMRHSCPGRAAGWSFPSSKKRSKHQCSKSHPDITLRQPPISLHGTSLPLPLSIWSTLLCREELLSSFLIACTLFPEAGGFPTPRLSRLPLPRWRTLGNGPIPGYRKPTVHLKAGIRDTSIGGHLSRICTCFPDLSRSIGKKYLDMVLAFPTRTNPIQKQPKMNILSTHSPTKGKNRRQCPLFRQRQRHFRTRRLSQGRKSS